MGGVLQEIERSEIRYKKYGRKFAFFDFGGMIISQTKIKKQKSDGLPLENRYMSLTQGRYTALGVRFQCYVGIVGDTSLLFIAHQIPKFKRPGIVFNSRFFLILILFVVGRTALLFLLSSFCPYKKNHTS